MAVYTHLERAEIEAVLARYGYGAPDVVRAVAEGTVNSSFALECGGERLFLRVYEEQDRDGAAREARLLAHLAARGARTPRPLARRDGTLVGDVRGKPCALFPFVPGEMLCQAAVAPAHARALGAELARLHRAAEGAEPYPSRFDAGPLRARLDAVAGARDPELARLAEPLGRELDAVERARLPLATGVVHADVFRDNVLWEGDRLSAVLDFESAATAPFAYDLAVTVLAWTYGAAFDGALAAALVAGYVAERPLGEDERRGLFDEARFAALRFTVTRITDVEMRRAPGDPPPKKRFGRFRARARDLDAMGPAGFAALLGLA